MLYPQVGQFGSGGFTPTGQFGMGGSDVPSSLPPTASPAMRAYSAVGRFSPNMQAMRTPPQNMVAGPNRYGLINAPGGGNGFSQSVRASMNGSGGVNPGQPPPMNAVQAARGMGGSQLRPGFNATDPVMAAYGAGKG